MSDWAGVESWPRKDVLMVTQKMVEPKPIVTLQCNTLELPKRSNYCQVKQHVLHKLLYHHHIFGEKINIWKVVKVFVNSPHGHVNTAGIIHRCMRRGWGHCAKEIFGPQNVGKICRNVSKICLKRSTDSGKKLVPHPPNPNGPIHLWHNSSALSTENIFAERCLVNSMFWYAAWKVMYHNSPPFLTFHFYLVANFSKLRETAELSIYS